MKRWRWFLLAAFFGLIYGSGATNETETYKPLALVATIVLCVLVIDRCVALYRRASRSKV